MQAYNDQDERHAYGDENRFEPMPRRNREPASYGYEDEGYEGRTETERPFFEDERYASHYEREPQPSYADEENPYDGSHAAEPMTEQERYREAYQEAPARMTDTGRHNYFSIGQDRPQAAGLFQRKQEEHENLFYDPREAARSEKVYDAYEADPRYDELAHEQQPNLTPARRGFGKRMQREEENRRELYERDQRLMDAGQLGAASPVSSSTSEFAKEMVMGSVGLHTALYQRDPIQTYRERRHSISPLSFLIPALIYLFLFPLMEMMKNKAVNRFLSASDMAASFLKGNGSAYLNGLVQILFLFVLTYAVVLIFRVIVSSRKMPDFVEAAHLSVFSLGPQLIILPIYIGASYLPFAYCEGLRGIALVCQILILTEVFRRDVQEENKNLPLFWLTFIPALIIAFARVIIWRVVI
ncbi:MAG: hypothetical protein Q4P72_02710 [Eubacteriales bacterium]|nr:hypothetical protein [Eubacteriales bacterium]